MLNTRAASEFLGRVRKEQYRLDIKPCSQIHDAQYYLIRDSMPVLLYVNKYLPMAVRWQEDPLIQNEHIKMSGQLEVYYPNWNHGLDLPNDIPEEEVKEHIRDHTKKLKEEGIL